METLEGRTGSETERRKQVTEAGREQAWVEREVEIAEVIKKVLESGIYLISFLEIWFSYIYKMFLVYGNVKCTASSRSVCFVT